MISRRDFLAKGCLCGAGGLAAVALLQFPFLATAQNGDDLGAGSLPLRDRARRKGLFYGAAGTRRALSDPEFAGHFARECGAIVPESELKWKALRPSPTQFDFTNFDWLLGFAQAHDMLFRGHTLAWHEELPPWFGTVANRDNAKGLLLQHIDVVAGRHAGKIHSWDVVNEPIALWDKDPEGMRTSSPWYKLLGPGYIDMAFRAAAQADPHAMLVLNQNRIEQERPGDDGTRKGVLKLLRKLKDGGTPVHALGIESHLGGPDAQFNAGKFRQFLSDVADLGLKIIITELDVTDADLPAGLAERDRIVSKKYEEFLSVALAEKAVIGVVTWGLSDRYTWLSKYGARKDALPVRPLPLDGKFHRKPAWHALARAFDAER